jgi:hypothetical protein
VQIYVDKARLEAAQPGGFAMLKGSVDVGDIVGATGSVKRTEKGELSVVANSLQASWRVAVPRRCEGVGQHCTLPMQPRQGELLPPPPPAALVVRWAARAAAPGAFRCCRARRC